MTPRWVKGDEVLRFNPLKLLRYAPSIISRNEAELFGLAMPRFALRAYLEKDNENLGFVNVRRLATFASQAPRWARRISSTRYQIEGLKRVIFRRGTAASLMRKNCCIADALLKPPARFKEWTMLKADLARAYGEVHGNDEDWQGTPYIRHIALSGGGLCAQATCFMATALLHREAHGVHGVADVTSLASPTYPSEMRLTGLSWKRMPDYFTHPQVGLNAIWQQALPRPVPEATVVFRLAMRSYLRSGMPIILPVDSGRLAGQPHANRPLKFGNAIRERNGHPPAMWFNAKKVRARNHAVLVVGTDGSDLFAFNDPATLPFLVASSAELAEVAVYADFGTGELRSCMFLPVTPSAVRMPLLAEPREKQSDKSGFQGLLSFRMLLQGPNSPLGWPSADLEEPGDWKLVQLGRLVAQSGDPALPIETSVQDLLRDIVGFGLSPQHWCWLQTSPAGLWLWDAETQPPARANEAVARKALLCVAVPARAGRWKVLHRQLPETTRPEEKRSVPFPRQPGKIQHSLISSFCVSNLSKAIEHWPKGVEACEIYAFMQPDGDKLLAEHNPRVHTLRTRWSALCWHLANWFRDFKRDRERYRTGYRAPFATAMQRLAAAYQSDLIHGDDRAAARLAAKLHFEVQRQRLLRIPAFATYIPEITSLGKPGEQGRDALLFLIATVGHLQKFGHPISTIEIVAGSCMSGIWPARDQKNPSDSEFAFVANRLPADKAIEHLLDRLLPLAKPALDAGVTLALELEPGPLYILRDWEAICKVCDILDNDAERYRKYRPLRPVLGLNLDVAHWGILKKISPTTVLGHASVRKRIVHAHVADHAAGHFGDVALLQQNDEQFFRDWLSAIETIAADTRPAAAPRFSNYVSLELESCCRQQMLAVSTTRLGCLMRDEIVSC